MCIRRSNPAWIHSNSEDPWPHEPFHRKSQKSDGNFDVEKVIENSRTLRLRPVLDFFIAIIPLNLFQIHESIPQPIQKTTESNLKNPTSQTIQHENSKNFHQQSIIDTPVGDLILSKHLIQHTEFIRVFTNPRFITIQCLAPNPVTIELQNLSTPTYNESKSTSLKIQTHTPVSSFTHETQSNKPTIQQSTTTSIQDKSTYSKQSTIQTQIISIQILNPSSNESNNLSPASSIQFNKLFSKNDQW